MRLIDADALMSNLMIEDFKEHKFCYPCKEIMDAIKEQPTIEERKTGKWLFPYGDKKYKRCSVCEKDYYSIPHDTNFCPNCGADMRGET